MNRNPMILTVIDTQGEMREIHLAQFTKSELVLGRERGHCDIVIEDPIISRVHGCFRMEGDRILYQDMGSRNGTFVETYGENRLLKKESGRTEIPDKTVLRIGAIDSPDKMVLILCNRTEEKTWKKVLLKNTVTTIGRTAENGIVLKHPGISKLHCQIVSEGGKCIVSDNRSINGVRINGKPVQSCVLKDKDIIQILDYQLIFSGTCIYYLEENRGIRLDASHVNKVVGKGKSRKKILDDVNCEIKGNEFVAIIGGSGAGKSTLMNAISGFDKGFTGHVYCNGMDLQAQFEHLKNIIGYVPQEDIIYENLTLRRMLYYTAKMKMPDDTGTEEIQHRIDEVLEMIDLKEHQNTFIRKLSGGQKKRASIAVELLADPKLFFLDEPTSGLDPGTEKNLMQTLNYLAKEKNKTIIMVTHTTQNLHLCDKVIFMGPGGKLCFCGNVEEAKQFFETEELVEIYNLIARDPQMWAERFQRKSGLLGERSVKGKQEEVKLRSVSAIKQFSVLVRRYIEIMKNDTTRLFLLLIQPLLIGILLHIVADKNIFKIYESTKSMLFALSCSGIWIGLFDSIQEICKERVILKREYMANLKLTGYMLSKFLVQAALGLVQSAILTLVFLQLTGVDKKGLFFGDFRLEILLTIWLTVLASIAMGFVISALVRTGDKAMAAAPFILIVQLLFSGILFELKGAGKMISYCTVSRWSVEGLGSIARLNKLDLKLQADFPMLEHKAEIFFKGTQGHLVQVWLILLALTLLFMVISTISLRKVANDSR